MSILTSARQFLFGYHATEQRKRRRPVSPILRDEDSELDATGRQQLNAGTRDIRRNFTVASWMLRRHVDYTTTFTHQSKTGNKALDKAVEAFVTEAGKPENFDRAGRHSRAQALRIAEASRTIDGDILAVRLADGRTQWIESDRIRNAAAMPPEIDRAALIHGVYVDAASKALAYAVCRRGNAGGLAALAGSYTFERMVPAQNCYLHAYRERFDQIRGVSPIASALNELADTYEAFDYARARMKVAQLFGIAFYRQAFPEETPGETLSADGDGYSVKFSDGPIALNLDPGDRAEFLDNATPATEFQSFTQQLIAIALKAVDIPYSFFDEAHTTYSGSRGAMLQYDRAADARRQQNRDLLTWLTDWRLTLAHIDNEFPGADLATILAGQHWHARGMPWMDQLKERMADIQGIAAGLDTRTRVLRAEGIDFDDIVDELQYEAQRLKDAGLPLTSDNANALIAALTTEAPAHAAPAA